MMHTIRKFGLLASILIFCAGACGESASYDPADTSPPETTARGETVVLPPDAPADRVQLWSVRAPDLTLWVEPELQVRWSGNRTSWILRGRVSEDLRALRAYTRDGFDVEATLQGRRGFEIAIGSSPVIDLLAGEDLLLELKTATEAKRRYHALVNVAPRFDDFEGSPHIFIHRAIRPVLVGGSLRFRARVQTDAGFYLEQVFTDDEADPNVVDEHGSWRLDWTPELLILAADPPEAPVFFVARDSGEMRRRKQARIALRLARLGLMTDGASSEWPPPGCEAHVARCLEALAPTNTDTETCGLAAQVKACLEQVAMPSGVQPAHFAEDLRGYLVEHYAARGDAIAAAGGRSLAEAQEAVEEAKVRRVDDFEAGAYYRYDPRYFEIFYHPDPIFADAAGLWYGVYEPSGRLVSIYRVN